MHLSQVHKEQLTEIENALPNRAGLDVEIFGMEGVPEDVLQAHQQRVAAQFQQAEVERQAATGNPPSGSGSGQPAKKPKLESVSDMKKRLAEHRAKRAEGAAGGSSGDVTPVGAGQPAPTPGAYVSFVLLQVASNATNVSQLGTASSCTCICTCACAAVLLPSALRRRRRRPLPTDRQSGISALFASHWTARSWCRALSSSRILTSAIPWPTRSSRLYSHSPAPPSTAT